MVEKLGQEASENDLLQELILTGRRPMESGNGAQSFQPNLAAHGISGPHPFPQSSTEEPSEASGHLRPIVIDGSNVAMRQASFHFVVSGASICSADLECCRSRWSI